MIEKKNEEIHPRLALFFSCSIWRIGYVLRIKRIRPDRYFRKLGKLREYIAPVEESRRKGAKLRAQERENPFSTARLRSSPRSGGFQRTAAGFLRNNREMGRTLQQDFGVAEAMVRSNSFSRTYQTAADMREKAQVCVKKKEIYKIYIISAYP